MNVPPDICETLSIHAPQRTWVAPMRATDEIITGQQVSDNIIRTLGTDYPGGALGYVAPLGPPEASQAVTYHTPYAHTPSSSPLSEMRG